MIVDGYCDVCGSPAGAPPFIAAVAAAQQPNLAEEETPTRRIPRVQLTAEPPSAQEMADSGAADPDERPTQRIPRVEITEQPQSGHQMTDPPAADPDERPTQRIPRVLITEQRQSTQEIADSAVADPNAADTKNVDEEKVDPAASPQELSMAQGLSSSLVDIELMIASIRSTSVAVEGEEADGVAVDSVAVEGEADGVAVDSVAVEGEADGVAVDSVEVEGEADGVAVDSVEVEGEADGVAVDSVEVEGEADGVAADSVEVEGEADGVAADSVEVDAEKVDAVATDTEKTDRTPTDTDDADTMAMPPVGAVLSGGRQPLPQPAEQQVLGPAPVQDSAGKKRFGLLALAAIILAALLIGALFFSSRNVGGVTAQPDATVTATATMPVSNPPSERSDEPTKTGGDESAIQMDDLPASARPLETVRIQGTYRGGADVLLRVQRWEGGEWLDFPVPTKTDQSGHFTTYVELGQPGAYSLRVFEPDSGATSKTFVLVIKV
jgi:hypothetical protein